MVIFSKTNFPKSITEIRTILICTTLPIVPFIFDRYGITHEMDEDSVLHRYIHVKTHLVVFTFVVNLSHPSFGLCF